MEEWKGGRIEDWKEEGRICHLSILPFFHPSNLPFFHP
jgi:hypothetical protein